MVSAAEASGKLWALPSGTAQHPFPEGKTTHRERPSAHLSASPLLSLISFSAEESSSPSFYF